VFFSFVCFLSPLVWFFLWLPEEVLALMFLLHRENGDFFILMKDIVSQWKVGDSSTCELMKGFYRELRSGKDVSPSLCGAMLKMIRMGAKFMNGPPLLFVVCLRNAFLQSYKLEPPHVRVMTMGHQVTQAEISGPKFAFCLAFVSIKLSSTSVREHLNVLQMESHRYLIDLFIPLNALSSIWLQNIVCKQKLGLKVRVSKENYWLLQLKFMDCDFQKCWLIDLWVGG